jgi:hypothetical protein
MRWDESRGPRYFRDAMEAWTMAVYAAVHWIAGVEGVGTEETDTPLRLCPHHHPRNPIARASPL